MFYQHPEMKKFIFSLALVLLSFDIEAQTNKSPEKILQFNELTFHSTGCNKACPDISVNINSDKRIQLVRAIYSSSGKYDSLNSGTFKGMLSDEDFMKLLQQLEKYDFDSLQFPEVMCCDFPIKTIIISYNGKYKRFKSMTPPKEANNLINFLTQLSTKISLSRYNKPIDFEE